MSVVRSVAYHDEGEKSEAVIQGSVAVHYSPLRSLSVDNTSPTTGVAAGH
jgi:hypothetical protein